MLDPFRQSTGTYKSRLTGRLRSPDRTSTEVFNWKQEGDKSIFTENNLDTRTYYKSSDRKSLEDVVVEDFVLDDKFNLTGYGSSLSDQITPGNDKSII